MNPSTMQSSTPQPPTQQSSACRQRAPLIGLAPLMRRAFSGADMKQLGTQLIERSAQYPDDAHTLMDLSTVLQLTGNREIALATQAQALAMQQIYHLPAATGEAALRVLAIMAPGDLMANTPLEFLLEDSDIALDLLYLTPGLDELPALPDHDVLFVAVGESDDNRALLELLAGVLPHWPRPVLNKPECVARLSRDSACRLLQSADGITMPTATRVGRGTLEQIAGITNTAGIGDDGIGHARQTFATLAEGSDFPIIVRPVGSHAGTGLAKVETPAELAVYLKQMDQTCAEFYVAPFVDYRNADGLYRKYRIMLIEGQPFICHMAVSAHWMIHYLNAGMTDSADKRAEEERFMAEFDQGFARRHADAFHAINERIGLDYVGIDCAETADGKLLIFEADSDMIVHAMDPVDLFPYKQPQMRKLFTAFRQMLVDTAARRCVNR